MSSPSQPLPFTSSELGPYTPTLILHGGAGAINRTNLPPELYSQYRSSLLAYLSTTHSLLASGHTALDAACHAVTLLEDDALYNCGRGSVFTSAGRIEMEASVMVCSVRPDSSRASLGLVKRAAGVSMVKETRHPILLAREVLLQGEDGRGGVGSMHCQISGADLERWGWEEKGLERKEAKWFWTRKRWEEHLRNREWVAWDEDVEAGDWIERLGGMDQEENRVGLERILKEKDLPSQGTVGAVCMDSWGNLAVATSTGGLTNKKPGRIGDTPTVGAGFWAETWEEKSESKQNESSNLLSINQNDGIPSGILEKVTESLTRYVQDCLPRLSKPVYRSIRTFEFHQSEKPVQATYRAVAMSGTGNGDSFIRTNAVRTAAAICRFGDVEKLQSALDIVAGPNGELQRSAGDRFGETGEGEGGIIGLELNSDTRCGEVCFAFNCGGMFRAWIDRSGKSRMMVFHEDF